MTDRTIIEAADVTSDILEAAEEVFNGWFADSARIDWEDFVDRLESSTGTDFGDSMLSPAIKKIQAHVRAYRKLES